MIARADFWLALGAATGLHAAALTVWAPDTSGGGGGAEGNAAVSVAAVDPSLQAMVETWTRPPEAVEVTAALDAPSATDAPARPSSESTFTRRQMARALPLPVATERAPERVVAPTPMTAPTPPTETFEMAALTRPTLPDSPRPTEMLSPADAPPAPPKLDATPPFPAALITAPKPEPRPSRQAVAERVALGSGGGATAGRAASEAVRSTRPDTRAADQARWAAQIQQRIARFQSYPRGARASGRVRVTMVIMQNGALGGVNVTRSSGASRLDQAALRAVQRAAPFPPAPESLTDTSYRVGQWISFERR